MYIAIKKRSNMANESLAVFEFVSKKEAEDFFTGMNKFIENDGILQELKEIATEPLKRLESRCDDKYAHPGCALSAFLYSDEFEMLVLAFLMEASYKYSGTTLQCDDKLSDIEENNSLKNNTENN